MNELKLYGCIPRALREGVARIEEHLEFDNLYPSNDVLDIVSVLQKWMKKYKPKVSFKKKPFVLVALKEKIYLYVKLDKNFFRLDVTSNYENEDLKHQAVIDLWDFLRSRVDARPVLVSHFWVENFDQFVLTAADLTEHLRRRRPLSIKMFRC